MSAPNLTHKDIATRLGIAEATVKSYRRAFPEFFELRHSGKPLRFAASALDVCRIIRNGRKQALSVSDIRERLEQAVPQAKQPPPNGPLTARVHPEHGGPSSEQPAAGSDVIVRIEQVLTRTAEAQQQLVQIQGESATRFGAMQHRMFEALTALQDKAEHQDAIIETLTKHQQAILDMLADISDRLEHTAGPAHISDNSGMNTPPGGPSVSGAGGRGQPQAPGGDGAYGPLPRVTHVAVRNTYGEVQRYTLATGENAVPPTPAQADAAPPTPVQTESLPHEETTVQQEPSGPVLPLGDYLELPLVVRSEMGEYLGVAGKALGSFSLGDLVELVEESFPPPKSFHIRFEPGEERGVELSPGAAWTLLLKQDSGQRYRLLLERTTTPRGNDVVVLASLEVDGQDVPPANLYLFIKQMLQMRSQS